MVLKSIDRNTSNHLHLSIQLAAMADTKTISSVLAKSFYDFPEYAHWIYPFLQFTINEDLRYRLRSHSPMYSCLVAKLTETAETGSSQTQSEAVTVGTVELTLRSGSFWSNEPQYPYISNLAVKQDYRRLGVGSQLLARCEQIALDWGYTEIRLHVLDNNQSAKQLYCHNGYQIAQIESSWGNMWLDRSPRLLLKKQISTP